MLSIDEAIAHAREVAAIQRNNDKLNKTLGVISPYYKTDCIKCAEEHEQLEEWLEELKNIREENAYLHCEMQAIGATIDMLEEEIRNRAIDDYVERLKETYKPCKEADNYIYTVVCRRFDDIAQQLKAGGKNE